MAELPIIMGPQGPVPTAPSVLLQNLINLVSATNPDYTANLPGSLIEDISSTDVGALIIANQFLIDLINSVSPYGANPFLLTQLGVDVYGIQPANAGNTAVDLIFSGPPGFIIIPGFTVSDGQFQYVCTDGGVIGSNGDSLPVHAVATTEGTWAVPPGIVSTLITSVPSNIQLSVINPSDGIPSIASETMTSFRNRVLTAGLAASMGMDRYLKTLLWNIPGVVQRLVSVRQNLDTGRWIIFCGGGDPYQVAWAIYYAVFDIQSLDRPAINISGMSNTNPIVVQTEFNHNLTTGMVETFTNIVGMETLNGQSFSVTVINDKQFSIPVDGTTLGIYRSSGTVSPNPILQEVSLSSYPDSYVIPFVLPAQQHVTMVITWQTDFPNYVSVQAIAQAVAPAISDYVNSLYVGISPLNIYEMQSIFLSAVANIVPSENVTYINFAVSFDGVAQPPETNSGVIIGDPNSYFYAASSDIEVVQG